MSAALAPTETGAAMGAWALGIATAAEPLADLAGRIAASDSSPELLHGMAVALESFAAELRRKARPAPKEDV